MLKKHFWQEVLTKVIKRCIMLVYLLNLNLLLIKRKRQVVKKENEQERKENVEWEFSEEIQVAIEMFTIMRAFGKELKWPMFDRIKKNPNISHLSSGKKEVMDISFFSESKLIHTVQVCREDKNSGWYVDNDIE